MAPAQIHFYVAHHLAAAAGALAAAREFDARREELVGEGLGRAGMECELHWRPPRTLQPPQALSPPQGNSTPAATS